MKKKVLILDDLENLRFLYESFIRDWGYDTHAVADGLEGLAAYHTYQPDAIITDNEMPNMSGQEFVNRLREIDEEVPIYFHSGRGLPLVRGIPNLYLGEKNGSLEYIKDFLDFTIGTGIEVKLCEAVQNDKTGKWGHD